MKYNYIFVFSLAFLLVFQVSFISASINFKENTLTVFTIDENARGEGSLSIEDVTVRNGTISNLSSVFLLGQTLNFFTSPDNISMIINGNSTAGLDAIISKGQSPIGTTSFIGDVDNFDDIDAFSRFSETNINNGTNASAGFIGVNDVGNSISIGIASSNFAFGPDSFPNIGALRLGSPAEMIFLNDFINGWVWISDLNDSAGFQDAFTAMDLDPDGDLNVTGNLTIADKITFRLGEIIDNVIDGWIRVNGNLNVTGNLTIGEIATITPKEVEPVVCNSENEGAIYTNSVNKSAFYCNGDSWGSFGFNIYGYAKMKNLTGVEIDLVSVGVFENITGINNGSVTNGITYDGDHAFIINFSGFYEVSASVAFAGSSAQEYSFDFLVNGIEQDIFSIRQITTSSAEGSVSLGPYAIPLNVGDILTLGVADGVGPIDPTIIGVQIGVRRVGQ